MNYQDEALKNKKKNAISLTISVEPSGESESMEEEKPEERDVKYGLAPESPEVEEETKEKLDESKSEDEEQMAKQSGAMKPMGPPESPMDMGPNQLSQQDIDEHFSQFVPPHGIDKPRSLQEAMAKKTIKKES